MIERVIARRTKSLHPLEHWEYEPDPEAPSVGEVCEVLRAAEDALASANTGESAGRSIAALLDKLDPSGESA